MKITEIAKKILGIKKEESYPYEFGIIAFTEPALRLGLDDEFNKEIQIYKEGILERSYPYSELLLDNIKKIRKIPVYDETEKQEKMKITKRIHPEVIEYQEFG